MRTIEQILRESKSIAIVGASSNPDRPSFGIAQALQSHGYKILPVNPTETEILGEPVFKSLQDIPVPVDIVNVFRRPDHTPQVATEAVAIGAKVLWLQSGIENDEAEAIAKAGGLDVIMDRCIMVEHRKHRI
jgi:predicted CoA-binding protein